MLMELFQFTHPVRGATRQGQVDSRGGKVSIHAPREGCDAGMLLPCMCREMFQFTHPVRGATLRGVALDDPLDVSIHAPREGCDSPLLIASREDG